MRFLNVFLIFPLCLIFSLPLKAGIEEVCQIKKGTDINGSTVLVMDQYYGQPSTGFQIKKQQLSIKLFHNDILKKYNQEGWSFSAPYTANLKLADGTSRIETGTLSIEWDPDDDEDRKNIDIDLYSGVSYASVTVGTVSFLTGGGTPVTMTDPVYDDIHFEVSLVTERFYDISSAPAPDINAISYLSSDNTLDLSWDYIEGAEEYELEYVFVADGSDVGNHQGQAIPYDFRNATRINLTDNKYPVSMAFPKGSMIFRVRGVGYDLTKAEYTKYQIYTDWSYEPTTTTIAQANTDQAGSNCYYYYSGTELDKNWTYTSTYAENGKRKEVASYFDGSGRTRQMVTINNSDNFAIVGETKYDRVGRATVNVLPVPTANEGVKYYGSYAAPFNGPWNYNNFGTDNHLSEGNDTLPEPLPASSNANKYYSSSNNLDFINKKAIPNAGGYPYTMTHFTNDGTERPKIQSGLGDSLRYKAQESRNTRYYYGAPTQTELDRLFGNEAGHYSFYKKNIIIDPNRQQSIQYIDAQDRIVATALSGKTPDNLDTLPENTTEAISTPLFNGPRQPGTGGELIESMVYTSTSFDPVYLSYGIDQAFFPTCRQATPTIPFYYDVFMDVKNDRGETVADSSLINEDFRTQSNFVTFFPSIGSYTITRRITLNESNLQSFLAAEESALEAGKHDPACSPYYWVSGDTLCEPLDCDSACWLAYSFEVDSVTYFTDTAGITYSPSPYNPGHYRAITGDTLFSWLPTDTTSPWGIAMKLCEKSCEGYKDSSGTYDMKKFFTDERCDMKLKMLKFDLSPGGQYLDYSCDSLYCLYTGLTAGTYDSLVFTFSDPNIPKIVIDSAIVNDQGSICLEFDVNEVGVGWVYNGGSSVFSTDVQGLTYTYVCEPTLEGGVMDYNLLSQANTLLGTSYSSWAELQASWQESYGNILIQLHPEYCAFDYFCNYTEHCTSGPDYLYMDSINAYMGEMYSAKSYAQAINHTGTNGSAYNLMNPLGLSPQAKAGGGPVADNSNYIQSGIVRGTDPLFACNGSDTTLLSGYAKNFITRAMTNYLPIYNVDGNPVLNGGTQAYYSYWYVLDDPDSIAGAHGGNNSGLDTTIIKAFNAFHGDGECIEGVISDNDSRYLFFKSYYLFLREKAIYKYFDDQYLCSDNQTYTFWDADTNYDGTLDDGTGYKLNYPKNILFEIPAGFVHPDSLRVLDTITSGNEKYFAVSRLDSMTCDSLVAYLDDAGFNTGNLTVPNSQSAAIAAYLNNDFCKNYTSANIDSILLCASGQNYVYTNLLPEELRVSTGAVFTASQTEGCAANKRRLAIAAADERWEEAKARHMDSIAAAYVQSAYAALDTLEHINLNYSLGEYHYTLYYYDLAGNLVKTVPPDGVKPLSSTAVNTVQSKRLTGDSSFTYPAHTHITNYQYNTQNQITVQNTPDGGKTEFWYDNAARLVASQNAKQAQGHQYSYTLYDGRGRVVEVGQVTNGFNLHIDTAAKPSAFRHWINGSTTREEVTFTLYDQPLENLPGTGSSQQAITTSFGPGGQKFLRNRVASTFYIEEFNDTAIYIFNHQVKSSLPSEYLDYESASHYSYDPHGNVQSLVQEFQATPLTNVGRRFFRMDYEYDLVSGNVNQVTYQPGRKDQFYHKYQYDADNRIIAVETSRDGFTWDEDARYFYYPHGPLSRSEIGDMNIQGLDYAYTLQGWLKTVNGTSLGKQRPTGKFDLGKDGRENGDLNQAFAPDAMAFGLDYFKGDYTPITAHNSIADISGGSNNVVMHTRSLFNGNIARMTTALNDNLQNTTSTLLNSYHYDQLNRISAFKGFKEAGLTMDNISSQAQSYGYEGTYNYDPDGNIKHLTRKDSTGSTTDNFTYYYDSTAGHWNNRLNYVSGYGTQGTNNYTYDAIGNLITDFNEGIELIKWNVRGKISQIIKSNGDKINFTYDPMGNRISKQEDVLSGTDKTTYYVRDAQGNTMAVYEYTGSTVALKEWNLYGSDRLGIITDNIVISSDETQSANDDDIILAEESRTEFYFTETLGTSLTLSSAEGGSYMVKLEAINEPLTIALGEITIHDGHYTTSSPNIIVPIGGYVIFSSSSAISFAPSNGGRFALVSYGNVELLSFSGTYIAYDESASERVVGKKRYELKNHLGNVLSTVSDRKVWKEIGGITTTLYDQSFTPAANETSDLLDLKGWEPFGEGGVEYTDPEEGLLVYNNGGEGGGTRQFETSPYCYFKYCLTFSNIPEGTAISIYSHLAGGYIINNEPIEPSDDEVTYCWGISQYGSGVFDVYITLPEGEQLSITKEELFRTILPSGWSSFGTPSCLGMNEGGIVIPFDEEDTPGIETTIAVDPGCDQRICFVISDISGEGKLTVMDGEPSVIHTEYFSEADSICLTITGGSYSSLTLVFEMTSGESFTLANVTMEEICSINTQVADVMSAQDYYPFGGILTGRKYHPAEGMHRYGFNGMEQDKEVKDGDGKSYDFGARMYDPKIGKFLSVDNYSRRFEHQSPYLFAGNMPIIGVDVNGDSLYILTYVVGNDHGDEMFEAATLTRKYDIENSGHFDPSRDKVVVLKVTDLSQIETQVEGVVAENSSTYGETVEFGVWSHSGLDGPIGSESTSSNELHQGSTQMTPEGWGEINFNWSTSGNKRAGFYGCNSGNDSRGKNKSFTTQISGLANFVDVTVLGQTTSSYPSEYTNTRNPSTAQMLGSYPPVKVEEIIQAPDFMMTYEKINKTYMVGGNYGEGAKAYFGGVPANPMRSSKNGKSQKTNVSQNGDKEE